MSKQLYEETLADVKKLTETAEQNAQQAILAVVTPRIKKLIENELLGEDLDDDDDDLMLGSTDVDVASATVPSGAGRAGTPGAVGSGDVGVAGPAVGTVACVQPNPAIAAVPPAIGLDPLDPAGKVVLDIDAISDPAGTAVEPHLMGAPEEYELSLESASSLAKITKAQKPSDDVGSKIRTLGESVKRFSVASDIVKRSPAYKQQIALMISRVEDMYEHVQESIGNSARLGSYETQLETYFSELEKLQGRTMAKNNKRLVNEEDVTLKLTGLPDDLELDGVGVDLITGEDGEEVSLDGDDLGGDDLDAGGEDDLGGGEDEDLDFGGEDQGLGEALNLSDDTIVEIDEGMLRREIGRMKRKRLAEESVPSTAGGMDSKVFKSFGGGSDDGEPLDADINDQTDAVAALPLGEGEEDLDEADDLDESDDALDEIGDSTTRSDHGASATSVPSADKSNPAMRESLSRRVTFEKNLQERCQRRAKALKLEARKASAKNDKKSIAKIREEYSRVAKRFNESVVRSKKFTKTLAESVQASRRNAQNGAPGRPAESTAEKNLRARLAETNLTNAKLAYTNKLLQLESLSAKQKARVIEELNEAKTVREAQLIYKSMSRTLAGSSTRSITESRGREVLGSSSRATGRASTSQSLNEGVETERWARLAGISK